MLKRLRNNFGIPGILAIAALVFAMIGGAYAASNDGGGKATASAKGKKGPRGKRGPTGPTGPAGAQGAQGPAGAKGDAGAPGAQGAAGKDGAAGTPGTPGTNGTNGTSVTVTPIATGVVACAEQGGAKVKEDKTGGASIDVCNGKEGKDGKEGKEGSPWTLGGTLPKGATLTGAWSFNATNATGGAFETKEVYVPISFPIKLKEGLEEEDKAVHYSTQANFNDFDGAGPETIGCGPKIGGVENPTAPEGHLCVYSASEGFGTDNSTFSVITSLSFSTSPEASKAGAIMQFTITGEPAFGFGSWAVTGF